MIALSLLLAQAASPVPQPAAPDDEVVVIGKRLKKWTGKVSTTFGITTCRTTISTGDPNIDAVGCAALKECWSYYRPALDRANDRKRPVEERRAADVAVRHELGQCLVAKRDALVAALAERRRAAEPAT